MKLKGYKLEKTAVKKSEELGCEGTHKHGDIFMPCKTHKQYLSKLNKTEKGELDELVDFDGTMNSSKIPFGLNPKLHPRKTMDQTVPSARITNDPLSRGFRAFGAYFSPTLKEVNFEDAFGYEETKFMDAKETIEYLMKELGMEEGDAKERAEQFGKKPAMDKKSEFKDDKNFEAFFGRFLDLQQKCDLEKITTQEYAKEQYFGNIEYKLKLANPDLDRVEHLTTQMKFRLKVFLFYFSE